MLQDVNWYISFWTLSSLFIKRKFQLPILGMFDLITIIKSQTAVVQTPKHFDITEYFDVAQSQVFLTEYFDIKWKLYFSACDLFSYWLVLSINLVNPPSSAFFLFSLVIIAEGNLYKEATLA